MDNASDKKPLLSSNSSQASEPSNKDSREESKIESKKDSKKDSKQETPPASGPESGGGKTPPASGGDTKKEASFVPNRIVRPTVQARPFSTRTKGVYWIFTILHLILLLTVLFAISYGLLQLVFAQTKNGPLYWGQGSFIGGVPSIMYEPVKKGVVIDKVRFGIKFNPLKPESFKDYVKQLKKVSIKKGEDVPRCDVNEYKNHWTGRRENEDKVCLQNVVTQLPSNGTDDVCDPEKSDHMGYDKSTPCLLIRLTKLLGFFPMSDKQEGSDERPEEDKNSCEERISFKCTARAKDANVTLLVPEGIPFCHFPFWKQEGYIAPYIMIRPEKPLPVGRTSIKCFPDLKSLKKLSNGNKNEIKIEIEIEGEEKKTEKTA